jgi:hypothetical protein
MAACESLSVRVTLEMGLLEVLDELAKRASYVDSETRKLLTLLCLDD